MDYYTVTASDTIERIAAIHDCTPSELIKCNRMASRMVFPGQKIKIPSQDAPAPINEQRSQSIEKHENQPQKENLASTKSAPGRAVRTSSSEQAPPVTDPDPTELDAECLQKFLKLKVKQFTDSEGVVSGTLLVTPNCFMFDPDVNHPLVRENGPDKYGMVAPMAQIMSVALYKDISAMTGETTTPYMPDKEPQDENESAVFDLGGPSDDSDVFNSSNDAPTPSRPDATLESIVEQELSGVGEGPSQQTVQRRHLSDLSNDDKDLAFVRAELSPQEHSSKSCPALDVSQTTKPGSFDSQQPVVVGAPKRLGSLRKTISARASHISGTARKVHGTLSTGAQSMAGAVSTSAKSAADVMSTGAKSAAEGISTGAQTLATGVATGTKVAADTLTTGAKVAATGAKAAAGAVTRVPHNIVNMSTGLFTQEGGVMELQESWFGIAPELSPADLRRQQSMATLQTLRERTQSYRQRAKSQQTPRFTCATQPNEMPALFKPVEDLLLPQEPSSPGLPFYLCVKLNRRRKRRKNTASVSDYDWEPRFGNMAKKEFWFTIPRDRADTVYAFLLQWSPEKYGGSEQDENTEDQRAFLILEAQDAGQLLGEQVATPLLSAALNREWEIVTIEEVRRRLSLSQLSPADLPIPAGALSSGLLNETQIRQLIESLPPRAEGYPWIRIYSSNEHGFSLRTLYRRMQLWREELSPTLLIVRDTTQHVFGALLSSPIRTSEHFYGTGDSTFVFTCLSGAEGEVRVWHWTGENDFFLKASQDSLCVGAGGGHYGLWLDADLNHGRTRHCETFHNEPLTFEDFIIADVEAFGFSFDTDSFN